MRSHFSVFVLVAFLALVCGHYRGQQFNPNGGGVSYQIGGQPNGVHYGGSWRGNGGGRGSYGYGGHGNIGYSLGGRGGYRGGYRYSSGLNGLLNRLLQILGGGSSGRIYYGGGNLGGLINQILRLVQGGLSGGLQLPGHIIIGGNRPISGGINIIGNLLRQLRFLLPRIINTIQPVLFGGLESILQILQGSGFNIGNIQYFIESILEVIRHIIFALRRNGGLGVIVNQTPTFVGNGGLQGILRIIIQLILRLVHSISYGGGINGGLGVIIQLIQRLLGSIAHGGGLNGIISLIIQIIRSLGGIHINGQFGIGGLLQRILSLIGGGFGGYYNGGYSPGYQIVYRGGYGPQIRSAGGKGLVKDDDDDADWKEESKKLLEQWKAARAKGSKPESKAN